MIARLTTGAALLALTATTAAADTRPLMDLSALGAQALGQALVNGDLQRSILRERDMLRLMDYDRDGIVSRGEELRYRNRFMERERIGTAGGRKGH